MTLLSCLIKSPPPPIDSQPAAADTALDAAQSESASCRLVKIERAGDVLHIFSHIRKTYRVQWVVLKGGGADPPELAKRSSFKSASSAKKTKVTITAGLPKLEESMWIRLGDVEKSK